MSRWRGIWARVTTPSVHVPEKLQERARLLAALLAIMVVSSLPLMIAMHIVEPYTQSLGLVVGAAYALAIMAYGLSRTRWYRAGGILLVLMLMIVPFVTFLISGALDRLYFMSIGFLFALFILPSSDTVWFGISIVLLAGIGVSVGSRDPGWFRAFFFIVMVAIFGVLVALRTERISIQRKDAEDRASRAERIIYQQQRLEALGTLVSGAAHEINNPIQAVLNYGLIIREAAEDPEVVKFADIIVKQSERVARLTTNMLQFSARSVSSEAVLVSGQDLVDAFVELVLPVLNEENIELRLEIDPDLPQVRCVPLQIEQVMVNLIRNSVDSLRQRFSSGHDQDKWIAIEAGQNEQRLKFRVRDNGIGLGDGDSVEIFDPFFTTKPPGEGTGLGLSVSREFALEHGGDLYHTPTDAGCLFTLELPLPRL